MRTRLMVLLLSLAFLGSASAGVLKVNDEDGILTDRAELEAAVAAVPFDVLVVASTKAPSKAEFDHYIDGLVQGAQAVVIGLDISKRHSHAIAGPWIRISGSAISEACKAGNPYFKERKYGAGVARIVTEINAGVTPVAAAPMPGTVSPSGLPWEVVIVGGLLFGLVVWGAIALLRRKKSEKRRERAQDDGYFSGGEYRQPIVTPAPGRQTYARVPYAPTPAPSTVVVDRGTNLTDYLVMDHILNHSQSAPAPAPAYRAPDPPAPKPSSSSSWGGFSSGGSDWGSGSGSSGGSDFGGGGDSGGGSSGGGDW